MPEPLLKPAHLGNAMRLRSLNQMPIPGIWRGYTLWKKGRTNKKTGRASNNSRAAIIANKAIKGSRTDSGSKSSKTTNSAASQANRAIASAARPG